MSVTLKTASSRSSEAKIDVIRPWLASLGALCKSSGTVDDASVQVNAYAVLLADSFDVGIFNETTFRQAAEKFTFWPAYAEIYQFLCGVVHERETRALPPPEETIVITDEERQRRLAELDKLKMAIKRVPS